MAKQENRWIASDNTAWDTQEAAEKHERWVAFDAVCQSVADAGTPIVANAREKLFAALEASSSIKLTLA